MGVEGDLQVLLESFGVLSAGLVHLLENRDRHAQALARLRPLDELPGDFDAPEDHPPGRPA